MKVAIFNLKKRVFMASNTREYSLVRKVRRAPSPYIFNSTSKARDFIRVNNMEGYICAVPDSIKQSRPRQAIIKRYKA